MNTRRKPTQAESLGAGIVAGAVEGFITYPAEFVKTKAQFSRSAAGEVSSRNQLSANILTRIEAGSDLNREEHAQNWRFHCPILGMWSFGGWKRSESGCALYDLRLDQGATARPRGECNETMRELMIRESSVQVELCLQDSEQVSWRRQWLSLRQRPSSESYDAIGLILEPN